MNIFAFSNIAKVLLIPYLTIHSLTAKNGPHVYTPGVKRFPIYLMLSVWNLQTYMQTIKPPIEQAKRGKQAAELRIFPNPARELLTVILPDHLTTGQLEIFSLQGPTATHPISGRRNIQGKAFAASGNIPCSRSTSLRCSALAPKSSIALTLKNQL